MKLSYRKRLFLYVATIFAVFTVGIVIFEQRREKQLRTEILVERLNTYSNITNQILVQRGDISSLDVLDSLIKVLPTDIRLTMIDTDGEVLFDNSIEDVHNLENHAERPEVTQAIEGSAGIDIRTSSSTNRAYLYYAKKFGGSYIRVALPYDIQTQRFLKPDNLFLYFILLFCFLILVIVNVVTGRFGKSIEKLRDFAIKSDKETVGEFEFPKDELGEIGAKITENYNQLQESKKAVLAEREKLLQHVYGSEEGICFFTDDRKVEFYNGLFIQYLNALLEEPNSEPDAIFKDEIFKELNVFLKDHDKTFFETQLNKHGKIFGLRINIFENKGFEVVLNDITKSEKTRRLKQEMTGNIAHELRTPVTSIRGYLETVLEQPLDKHKKQYFIAQAYNQTIVLSELIRDMSLITKMEESPQSFQLEEVDLNQLLVLLQSEFETSLDSKNIKMQLAVADNTVIKGNRNLLHSLFRNLIDNAINYAGSDIKIHISLYKEDKDYFYLSFYDTGSGIADEKHLSRIFERFYRVNEGRTRDTGGSGLGLSIVRNSVAFHRGRIVAKNRKDGGLEFLFQLHK